MRRWTNALPLSLVLLAAGCTSSYPNGPHRRAPAPVPLTATPPAPPPVAVLAEPMTPPAPAATLPTLFGDHMVLQAGKPLPIWGTAAQAGRTVTATLFRTADGKILGNASATADADGRFRLVLPPVAVSSEPHSLRITSAGQVPVQFENILLGEVWICSGQSNMQFNLSKANNATNELAQATHPTIRLFTVPNRTALDPQSNVEGTWKPCDPATARGFSAVGYFFGRDLQAALDGHPPIGLINTSWGGTPAQSWTSLDALRSNGFTNYVAGYQTVLAATNTTPEALAAYTATLEASKASTLFPDRPMTSASLAWSLPETDDSDWPTMPVPGPWEKVGGLANLNGAVWLRRSVEIPVAWVGKDLLLELGKIDDCDKTFFNGLLVGETGKELANYWEQPRSYTIPGASVKAGRTVVAVRVFDDYSNGGICAAPQRIGPADHSSPSLDLSGDWRYRIEYEVREVKRPDPPGWVSPHTPSALFNAMVHPLIPYAIAGAIWYQGESNAGQALEYQTLFPTMINDWRSRWGQGDFPFLWCQLANFMRRETTPSDPSWARLREAQTLTLKLPATGQAVLIDVGDADDIHPRDKQTVGYRLSRAALRVAYGRDVVHSGPVFQSVAPRQGALVVRFGSVGGGLEARGEKLEGFAVAGPDGRFQWAEAQIEGDTVVVRSADVTVPVAVRYAWGNNPAATLYNREGLPAVPFDARLPEADAR